MPLSTGQPRVTGGFGAVGVWGPQIGGVWADHLFMPNECPLNFQIVGPPDELTALLRTMLVSAAEVHPEVAALLVSDPQLEDFAGLHATLSVTSVELNLVGANDPPPDGADLYDYWGDRWGTGLGQLISFAGRVMHYRATAAWTPPIAALDRVAAAHPDLMFTCTYDEPGEGFAGTTVWFEGRRRLDRYWHDSGIWKDETPEKV